MSARRSSMSLIVAAVATVAACGPSAQNTGVSVDGPGDSGTRPSDGGDALSAAPGSAALACMQLNEAEAQLAARCQGGSLADWRVNGVTSLDCAAYDRHVAEGRVEYRPELLAACLAKYTLPCGEANPYPCYYEVLHGKVADGQLCQDTEVCGTVSGCVNLDGATCGDICVRLGEENETCGIYCGGSTPCLDAGLCRSGLFCLAGACVKTRALGETCGGPDAAACGFGLFCDADPADPTASGVCARLASGSNCRSDLGCPPNEFCLGGTCTPRRTPGASCADAPDSCAAWSVCDPNGSQLCVRAGRIGQPCGPFSASAFGCLAGTCDGQQCVPLGARGDSCPATGCVQGTFCDGTTTTCRACGG